MSLESGDAAAAESAIRAARALGEAGNIRGAVQTLRRGLASAPDNVEALWLHAFYLNHAGDAKEAELSARAAVRLAPEDATAHRILGSVLAKNLRRSREARLHLDEALRLAPEDGWTYYQLGHFHAARRRPRYARRAFAEAARRLPESPLVLGVAAQYSFALARAREGRDYAARAFAADPGSAVALAARARASLSLGRWREALDLAEAAAMIEGGYEPAVEALVEARMCRNPLFRLWSRLKGWSSGGRLRSTLLVYLWCMIGAGVMIALALLGVENPQVIAWSLPVTLLSAFVPSMVHGRRVRRALKPVKLGKSF